MPDADGVHTPKKVKRELSDPDDIKPQLPPAKSPKTPRKAESSSTSSTLDGNDAPTNKTPKSDAWGPDARMRLWEVYQNLANVSWREVADMMGPRYSAQSCREQFQRTMGRKIKAALQ